MTDRTAERRAEAANLITKLNRGNYTIDRIGTTSWSVEIERALAAAEERGANDALERAAHTLDLADYGPFYLIPGAVVPNAIERCAKLVRALKGQP